jgi:hypothetical protein
VKTDQTYPYSPFLDEQLLLHEEQAEGAQEADPAKSVERWDETAVPLLMISAIAFNAAEEGLAGCIPK